MPTKNALMLVSTTVFVFAGTDILYVRQNDGTWGLPSDYLKEGETLEQAVLRILRTQAKLSLDFDGSSVARWSIYNEHYCAPEKPWQGLLFQGRTYSIAGWGALNTSFIVLLNNATKDDTDEKVWWGYLPSHEMSAENVSMQRHVELLIQQDGSKTNPKPDTLIKYLKYV